MVTQYDTYAELFAQSPDPAFVTTPEGRVLDANAAMLALFGFTRADLPQLDVAGLYRDASDRERFRAALDTHGVVREFETVLRTPAGRDLQCLVTAVVRRDAEGRTIGYAGTLRDVTMSRRTEHELRHALRLDSLGRLAAGIAHEINTPSQYVTDSIHFLQTSFGELRELLDAYRGGRVNDCDHDRARALSLENAIDLSYLEEHIPRACERALAGMERIGEIVRAMRSFGSAGPVEPTPADINDAVQATLTVARGEYKHVADIVLDLGDLPLVSCRIADVRQVLLNLLTNAAEAIQQRNDEPLRRGSITIRSRAYDGNVELSVSDTGTGIAEELRARIFEPFFTTKQVGRGIGEGLASSRTLVERNAGTIRFESVPGTGTTFIVTLPIVRHALMESA